MEKKALEAWEAELADPVIQEARGALARLRKVIHPRDLKNSLHSGRPTDQLARDILVDAVSAHYERSQATGQGISVLEAAVAAGFKYLNSSAVEVQRIPYLDSKGQPTDRSDYRVLFRWLKKRRWDLDALVEVTSGDTSKNAGARAELLHSARKTFKPLYEAALLHGGGQPIIREHWLMMAEGKIPTLLKDQKIELQDGTVVTFTSRALCGQTMWYYATGDTEFFLHYPVYLARIRQQLGVDGLIPEAKALAVERVYNSCRMISLIKKDGYFDWRALAKFKNANLSSGPLDPKHLSFEGTVTVPHERSLTERMFGGSAEDDND